MGESDDRQLQERQRIEQQLKSEIEDLEVGEGADEVVGGVDDGQGPCGSVE
jgi:hypothetical protein